MGREIILFRSKEKKTLSEAAAFLRALAEKLETGNVILRHGDQDVEVELTPAVTFEMKVEEEEKSRGTQKSLEVEMKWYPGDKHGEGTGGVTLG